MIWMQTVRTRLRTDRTLIVSCPVRPHCAAMDVLADKADIADAFMGQAIEIIEGECVRRGFRGAKLTGGAQKSRSRPRYDRPPCHRQIFRCAENL
jgi:hypothetical protein